MDDLKQAITNIHVYKSIRAPILSHTQMLSEHKSCNRASMIVNALDGCCDPKMWDMSSVNLGFINA